MIGKNGKANAELIKQKIKVLNGTLKKKLTVSQLKSMKGFEHLSDEMAKVVLNQLKEYVNIILSQMSRMKKRTEYEKQQ